MVIISIFLLLHSKHLLQVEPYMRRAILEEICQLFSQMRFSNLLLFMFAEELLVLGYNLQITLVVDDVGKLVHHFLRVEFSLCENIISQHQMVINTYNDTVFELLREEVHKLGLESLVVVEEPENASQTLLVVLGLTSRKKINVAMGYLRVEDTKLLELLVFM